MAGYRPACIKAIAQSASKNFKPSHERHAANWFESSG